MESDHIFLLFYEFVYKIESTCLKYWPGGTGCDQDTRYGGYILYEKNVFVAWKSYNYYTLHYFRSLNRGQ